MHRPNPKLSPETVSDITAFLRSVGREMARAEGRLCQAVWRNNKTIRIMARSDYVLTRLHMQRAQRLVHRIETYLDDYLEAEGVDAFFEAEPEPFFHDPIADLRTEERLSKRFYDI